MKILAFDTETTNLLKDDLNDVHIIQLAWVLYDCASNKTEENNFILKVPVKITNSNIHGITTKQSDNGYYIGEIIDIFLDDVKHCDILVGHNLEFDLNVLELELHRLQLYSAIDLLYSKTFFDTMLHGQKFLKKSKFPKLQNLYKALFDECFENAHNALFDVKATLKCYLFLRNQSG